MEKVYKADKIAQMSPEVEDDNAATIDISDDDSREGVLVITDDNEETEKAGSVSRKKDIGDIENCAASSLPDSHDTTSGCSVMAASSKSSPAETTVISSSSSETVDSHSQTPSGSKQKSGRKSVPKSFPENLLDEDDLDHLRIPFSHGWKRELVYRSTFADANSKRAMCDVYYFPPSGRKLRSMVEICAYLESQKDCPVNLTHFTFKRKPMFQPPHEVVRSAGKASKKLPNVQVPHKITVKQKKPEISNSDKMDSVKRNVAAYLSVKSLKNGRYSAANHLSIAADDSHSNSKGTSTDSEITCEILSVSSQDATTPLAVPRGRGRPKGPKVISTSSDINVLKKRGRPRIRRVSPEWTPDSDGYSSLSAKKRRVEMMETSPLSCDDGDDSDYEDSGLQDVLGTPSKLIASIIRPDSPKNVLEGGAEVTLQTSKRVKVVRDPAFNNLSLSTAGSALTLDDSNRTPLRTFIITNSHIMTMRKMKTCSHACMGVKDNDLVLLCTKCEQLFHKECAVLGSSRADTSMCSNCIQNQTKALTLSSSQLYKSQISLLPKLVSSSMATQGLGSLAAPMVLSSCMVTASVLSQSLSKPLMATSSQFLQQQMISPVILIPGQNTGTIPPPPPLASCPRFDTPFSLLPMHFTSDVPPPPRLQLCSIPPVLHPPPVLLPPMCQPSPALHPGPIISSFTQTSSLITQPPTLQSYPPPLSSRPPTLQPSVNTSDSLVAKINNDRSQHPSRLVFLPVVSKQGPPSGTELQARLIAGSDTSSSHTEDVGEKVVSDISADINDVDSALKIVGPEEELNIQSRESSPSLSDTDDYPPVIFGPVTAHNETEGPDRLQTHPFVTSDVGQLSSIQNASKQITVLHPGPRLCPPVRTSRMIRDMLNSPTVDGRQTHISDSALVDSLSLPDSNIISSLPDFRLLSANTGTEPNNQPFTLPSPVPSRLDGNTIPKFANTELIVPANNSNNNGTTQTLKTLTIKYGPTAVSGQMPISSNYSKASTLAWPKRKSSDEPKLSRRSYMSSFRVLQASFTIMVKIFRHLPIPDLLRASCVCKVWHTLGLHHSLWKRVRLEGIRVRSWEGATRFLNKVNVNSLSLTNSVIQANAGLFTDVWEIIQRTVPTLTCLEELFFDKVPASVLDAITEKMPRLISIGAETVLDTGYFSTTPMIPAAKTVENMSHAIEAVSSGRLSTSNAAKLFQVSEKDLIHLTQTTDKLTKEEEAAVVLCCLRLSRMGFTVQKDTVMSKCQEMFARRYLTTSPVPISDPYCKDLYNRNVPLFTSEVEIKGNDTLFEKFEAHYSALRRLFNSFVPRTTLSASQVLVFDLKPFTIDKEPGFNSLRSVAVTVLSVTSACGRFLPAMAVWPKQVEASHPDLINVTSKRGMPNFLHVFQYFQKFLSMIKERPIVILCNGNASLLSEKLISSCISDSVYLYCVPPDIAKFVFPGFHGGLLHVLKSQFCGLKCAEFASELLFLLKFKKKTINRSSKLAFTTTGIFPLNSRAPMQYQTVHLNSLPQQSCRKSANLSGQQQQNSHSPSEAKQLVGTETDDLDCVIVTDNQKKKKEVTTEHVEKEKTENPIKKSQPSPIVKKVHPVVTSSRGREHIRINYAHMLAKKVLNQARTTGQNNSHLKASKTSLLGDSTTAGTQGLEVETASQGSSIVDNALGLGSAPSPASLQDINSKPEVPSGEGTEVVECIAETGEKSDVATACSRADPKSCSSNESSTEDHDVSSESADFEMNTSVGSKKLITENSNSSFDTHKTCPAKSSSSRVRDGSNEIAGTKPISESKTALVNSCHLSGEDNNDISLIEGMEVNRVAGDVNEHGESEHSSSLEVKLVRSKMTQNKNRKIKTSNQLSEKKQENGDISDNGKEISLSRQKVPTASPENTAPKSLSVGSASGSKCDDKKELDTEQEKRLKYLGQISLIDHDYIIKFGACEDSGAGSSHIGGQGTISVSESCELPADHGKIGTPVVETSTGNMSPSGAAVCGVGHEDLVHVVADDVAETVVPFESAAETRSDDDSYGSSKNNSTEYSISSGGGVEKRKLSSSTAHFTKRSRMGNEVEEISSSSCNDSHTSGDDDDDDTGSSEDDSDDNKQTSDPDEEEEELEDDDSVCQMCMRATPPHSKDKIINWVDCDQNCGRWFHVICVVRSQSKISWTDKFQERETEATQVIRPFRDEAGICKTACTEPSGLQSGSEDNALQRIRHIEDQLSLWWLSNIEENHSFVVFGENLNSLQHVILFWPIVISQLTIGQTLLDVGKG